MACGDDGDSSSAGSGGAGTTSSNASNATTGSGAPCNPECTGGLECCDGLCVNKGNDINNCGNCGNACGGTFPFCNNGTCGTAPCDQGNTCDGTTNCCGAECCALGEICCVVPVGPVGPPTCTMPNENGTCEPGCPECVCASADTPIATPAGERPIAELAVGDLVYSVDQREVRAVRIARVNRVRVDAHRVVRLTLASGRVIEMSPRHPTADGRSFGSLRVGDTLQGAPIVGVTQVPYLHTHTYDILPASDTGAYFAAGAPVGSTLGGDPHALPDACF
jgi:hypothetical protein